jgi:hypothetical protein
MFQALSLGYEIPVSKTFPMGFLRGLFFFQCQGKVGLLGTQPHH